MTCCPHCQDAEDLFDRKTAKRDLRRYRKKGPRKSTRLLLDAIRAHGASGMTLLDVGGGVGIIQHELLESGLSRAAQVDASAAYLEVSRSEAGRRGNTGRVTYHHGDFTELADGLPEADIVTLDRVICCYPDMERLVEASLRKAGQIYGLVYPRESWMTRVVTRSGNLYFRLRRSAFRSYLHSSHAVDALVRRHGFTRTSYARTSIWQVVTYARTPQAPEILT